VVEHQVIRDHETNRSRGFGFVIFDSEEVVDELLSKGNMIDMADTQVSLYKWGLEFWFMMTYLSWFQFDIFSLFLSLYTFNLVRILPTSLPNVRSLSQ
jgi:heterogeneous nuclear ribonucleoprotein A1/A3